MQNRKSGCSPENALSAVFAFCLSPAVRSAVAAVLPEPEPVESVLQPVRWLLWTGQPGLIWFPVNSPCVCTCAHLYPEHPQPSDLICTDPHLISYHDCLCLVGHSSLIPHQCTQTVHKLMSLFLLKEVLLSNERDMVDNRWSKHMSNVNYALDADV